MAMKSRPEARVDRKQNRATEEGMSWIELESSWWGNEKLNSWKEDWWVEIDHETDDAVHLSSASNNADLRGARSVDVWLPKSKIEERVDPEWDVEGPDDAEGTITFGLVTPTRYGPKVRLRGDTYDAFAGDEPDVDPEWDETHLSFDGDNWTADADAQDLLAEACHEAGYQTRR